MTPENTTAVAVLIEAADMIVLHIGDKRVGLGKDVQEAIVAALNKKALEG